MVNSRSTREMQLLQFEMLKELDRICKKYNIPYSLAYGTLLGAVRHKGYIPWDTDTDIIVGIEDYDFLCQKLSEELKGDLKVYYIRNYKDKGPLLARIGMKDESTKWMHLDLFPMVGAPNNKIRQKIFMYKALLNKKIYFFKKVDIRNNYKNNILKKLLASLIKTLCLPIPSKVIYKYDKKLKNKYKVKGSSYLYNLYGSYKMREFIPKSFFENRIQLQFEDKDFSVIKEWDEYLTQVYGDYMIPKK